jgi:hypothetical protein
MMPAQNPYTAPTAPTPAEKSGNDAALALTFGIISLFFCAPLFAPLAIIRARRVLERGPDGIATLAIVLAALGLVTFLFGFAFLAIWQYLAPAGRPHSP